MHVLCKKRTTTTRNWRVAPAAATWERSHAATKTREAKNKQIKKKKKKKNLFSEWAAWQAVIETSCGDFMSPRNPCCSRWVVLLVSAFLTWNHQGVWDLGETWSSPGELPQLGFYAPMPHAHPGQGRSDLPGTTWKNNRGKREGQETSQNHWDP